MSYYEVSEKYYTPTYYIKSKKDDGRVNIMKINREIILFKVSDIFR